MIFANELVKKIKLCSDLEMVSLKGSMKKLIKETDTTLNIGQRQKHKLIKAVDETSGTRPETFVNKS